MNERGEVEDHEGNFRVWGGYWSISKMEKHTKRKKKDKHLLAYNILRHLRDLTPLIFRELKAAHHNLLPHVLRDGATVVLGVERGIAAQHDVDDHAERPQVTALEERTDTFVSKD